MVWCYWIIVSISWIEALVLANQCEGFLLVIFMVVWSICTFVWSRCKYEGFHHYFWWVLYSLSTFEIDCFLYYIAELNEFRCWCNWKEVYQHLSFFAFKGFWKLGRASVRCWTGTAWCQERLQCLAVLPSVLPAAEFKPIGYFCSYF